MPRVIAGEFGKMRLDAPKGDRTRPTADKVKEALFSILTPRLQAASFLDLYAGCGQMGIEAVSRGADHAVFIERDREALSILRANILKTHHSERFDLLDMPVQKGLATLAKKSQKFDIIYADPPYADVPQALEIIALTCSENKLLAPGGVCIIEHDKRTDLPQNVMKLTLFRCCKYGMTMLTFYSE